MHFMYIDIYISFSALLYNVFFVETSVSRYWKDECPGISILVLLGFTFLKFYVECDVSKFLSFVKFTIK